MYWRCSESLELVLLIRAFDHRFNSSVPVTKSQLQTSCRSFDHLVGAQQCRSRHFEAKRLGGLEVEDELEFRCPLDRKIGGLGAPENLLHQEGPVAQEGTNARS